MDRYGFTSSAQNDQVKSKAKQTCLDKYGVEYTSQIPESRTKANLSYYKNGTQKVSSQQKAIFDMLNDNNYKVELNFPLSSLSLDIMLNIDNVLIDIEYDGNYWHRNKNKDRRRDEYVKSQGYKVLRITSDKKVPSFDVLIEKIKELKTSNVHFLTFEV